MRYLPLAFMLVVLQTAAQATFPAKPLRILSGAAPGTPGDVIARILAEPLGKALGQPVVVENRSGAINTIALGAVAKAEPDGHTLGTLGMPSTVAPSLLPKMPYDTARDLAPVRQLSWVSNLLVVRNDSRVSSLPELVAAAKARPQQLTFASGGNGTPAHLAGELFKLSAAIGIRHVPFNGAVAGVSAVLGEQVDMMFAIAPSVIGHVRSGKLRALANSSPARAPAMPDVPTLSELGYAVDIRDWHGIVAPAATPKPIIIKIESALTSVLHLPEVRDRIAAVGMEVAESNADAFGVHIRSEMQKWARVVREAGLRAD